MRPKPLQIGPIEIWPPLILAPMSGVTNRTMRALYRPFGLGLTVTEFVSSNALAYGSRRTMERIDQHGLERPVSTQLWGDDPATMALAAKVVRECGADNARRCTHFGAHAGDDRLGLTGETVDDPALQRLDRVTADRVSRSLQRDLRQFCGSPDQRVDRNRNAGSDRNAQILPGGGDRDEDGCRTVADDDQRGAKTVTPADRSRDQIGTSYGDQTFAEVAAGRRHVPRGCPVVI